MAAIPSFSTAQAPPAVRRPVFAVTLGAAAQESGGLLGDVAAAVGLTTAAEDPWARGLETLCVQAGIAPFVDGAELVVTADSQAPPAANGDAASLSVGFEDAGAQLVFTGAVEAIARGIDGRTCVRLGNGGARLAALRVNQGYEQRSAGEIVEDLAAQAGVATDNVEDGIDLPFYVIDDRRSAYEHVLALARKCGHLVYFTPQDQLCFVPPQDGDPVRELVYGEDILAIAASEELPAVDAVRIVGEGAAGSQGADAWSWLVKDPSAVTASAGSGTRERLHSDASLRSSDAVAAAAQGAALYAGLHAARGRIWIAGAPEITPGATITIAGAPQAALNGKCLVYGVRHGYGKCSGFVTTVAYWKVGEGGLSALGALGSALGGLL